MSALPNDDWHARRDILISVISVLLGPPVFTKGNCDVTYSWSIADDQFKYFSNQTNGFTSKPVLNIKNSKFANNSSMEEVSFADLSSSALLQTVQPEDLMYFYDEVGHVKHASIISSVDNDSIKYSNYSVRAFDKDLSVGISSYSEVYVARMNDVILQR